MGGVRDPSVSLFTYTFYIWARPALSSLQQNPKLAHLLNGPALCSSTAWVQKQSMNNFWMFVIKLKDADRVYASWKERWEQCWRQHPFSLFYIYWKKSYILPSRSTCSIKRSTVPSTPYQKLKRSHTPLPKFERSDKRIRRAVNEKKRSNQSDDQSSFQPIDDDQPISIGCHFKKTILNNSMEGHYIIIIRRD